MKTNAFAPLIPNFPETAVSITLRAIFSTTGYDRLRAYIDAKLNERVWKDTTTSNSRIVGARLARLTRNELEKLAVNVTLGNDDYIYEITKNILSHWETASDE